MLIDALGQIQLGQPLIGEEHEKTVQIIRSKVSEEEYNRLMLFAKKRWQK